MRLLLPFLFSVSLLCGSEPEEDLRGTLELAKEEEIGPGKLDALAISPFCTAAKKELIAANWKALGELLRLSPEGLRVEKKEVRGGLAAMSFSITPPVGLGSATFHVYGLMKVGEGWKVAPVEGSFANAGLDFTPETERSRKELEDWMAGERVTGLGTATEERQAVMDKAVTEAVDAVVLKKAGAGEAVVATLEAIADNRPLRVLRWTGFPERDGQDIEWDDLEQTVLKGMKLRDRQGIWKNLRTPGLLFEGINFEGEATYGTVEIGVLNPYLPKFEQFEVLTFEVYKQRGRWQVHLPEQYAMADEDPRYARRFGRGNDRDVEEAGAKKFRKALAENGPVERFSSPEEAAKALAPMIAEKALREIEGWFVWDSSLKDLGEIMEFGKQWTRLYNRADLRTGEPHLVKGKDKALLVILAGAAKGRKGLEFELVKLARDEKGWGLFIGREESWKAEGAGLMKEFETLRKSLEADILEPLTARLVAYAPEGGKVTPEAASELLAAYRKGLEAREVETLLDLGAVLAEDQKGSALEETMALVKIEREPLDPDFSVVTAGEDFALGTLAGKPGPGADLQYDVILMVPTEKGLRNLVSADLWFVTNKAKELRNQASLNKLAKALPEEKSAALTKLLTEHLERVGAEIKKTKPSR